VPRPLGGRGGRCHHASEKGELMGLLECYLRTLTDADPAKRFLEVRWRLESGMGRKFVPATDVDLAAELIRRHGRERDTYVGVALRDREAGGRDAVSRSRVLFVEVDADASDALVERAPRPPSMTIESGTPGHLHTYWFLAQEVTGAEVKSANRKLAYRIGGDLASVDETRILRPPETANFKHDPSRPVVLQSLHPARVYELRDLMRDLEDPPGREEEKPRQPARALWRPGPTGEDTDIHEQLRAIPTEVYVQRLIGLEPNADSKVSCPWHEDRTPSLHCYDDGTFCCFGCRRGGTIFDFAGELWGMDTKGRAFVDLRARLAEEFGMADAAAERTRQSRTRQRSRGSVGAMSAIERQRVAAAVAVGEKGGR
jgi:hypothetical protein